MNNIHVICAIDSQIEYVEICLKSCLKIFPKENIGIASFNFLKEDQIKLKKLAEQNGILFFEFKIIDNPHILWEKLKALREIYGSIKISEYFYSLNFDNVYLLHNDIIVSKDYTSKFQVYQKDNWSFCCPFMSHTRQMTDFSRNWEISKNIPSKQIESTEYRLSNCVIIFNKKFINEIKNRMSIEQYLDLYKNPSIYCDCSCFEINHFNYFVSPILEKISEEAKRIENGKWKDFLKNQSNIMYVHFGENHKKLMKQNE